VQNGGLSNSLYAMYQKADNFRRTYGVSPEGGSISSLGAEIGLPVLGGSTSYQRVWGDYRQYVSLPWPHHVLAVRGLTGLNFGQNGGQFTVGGWDGSNRILNQMDLTAATDVFTSRVGLRGYDAVLANSGNQIGVVSAEYRFPIAEVNRGLWTLPFYLDRVYGAVGYEAANVWASPFMSDGAFRLDRTLHGASVELRGQLSLWRYIRTDMRLGVAQGLSTPAGGFVSPSTQIIFGFGNAF
jgi:outer membrane protein assembly factor BamA